MDKKSLITLILVVFVPILLAFGYILISEKTRIGREDRLIVDDATINNRIKANLSAIRGEYPFLKAASEANGEIYNNSYFCNDVERYIKGIRNQGVEVVCNSSVDGWAVQTEFFNGEKNYICIDSKSDENKISDERLGDSIICP